jgi:Bacterial CdiA-CT RNAse A domain
MPPPLAFKPKKDRSAAQGPTRKGPQTGGTSGAPAGLPQFLHGPVSSPRLPFSIEDLVGNKAVQRLLQGQIPTMDLGPEVMKRFQTLLHPQGRWRQYAEPRLKPDNFPSSPFPQLPPGVDLSMIVPAPQPDRRESDEFVVSGDEFGITIVHPWDDTSVRAVEQEHRYAPEAWIYETRTRPKETPAICYNLIAAGDDTPSQVLLAVGPGAWVETQKRAPYEGAKEWELEKQSSSLGHFQLTIVEMPDNSLVPLPHEQIDIETLLRVPGSKLREPTGGIGGAITRQDEVMFWATLIGGLAMAALPGVMELAFGLAEAAALAPEVGGITAELGESASLAGLEPSAAEPVATVAGEDVGAGAEPAIEGALAEEGLDPQAADPALALGPPEQRMITGGLVRHEVAGGHPIMEHVGLDDAALFERLAANEQMIEASTFTDVETAHDAVAEVIDTNAARIAQTRAVQEGQLVLQGRYSRGVVGRWLVRGGNAPRDVTGVTVLLRADPTIPWGFRIHTAYPSPLLVLE